VRQEKPVRQDDNVRQDKPVRQDENIRQGDLVMRITMLYNMRL
jgi:hypothetical protein